MIAIGIPKNRFKKLYSAEPIVKAIEPMYYVEEEDDGDLFIQTRDGEKQSLLDLLIEEIAAELRKRGKNE